MISRHFHGLGILLLGLCLSSCRDMEAVRQALVALNAPGAEYVGSETCGTCHEKILNEFKFSSHFKITVPNAKTGIEGCEMCHGAGSLHADAGGGRNVKILNPRKNPEICFSCHMEKESEFRMPFHHPVLEGRVSCADCHSLHASDARMGSKTALENLNDACFKCHEQQRGPFAWEHEAMRDGCTVCHEVHGSINDKMLIERDSTLCLKCHTQPNFPTIGKWAFHGDTDYLRLGTCYSSGCHTAVHGSNTEYKLRY